MKKIIKALLVVMVIAMAVMVFAACEKDPCKDGHTLEAIGEKLATCTEDGYSSGVVCSVCGYEQRRSFVLEAKGHDMAKATCDKPATCKACGYTEGEALGHDITKDVEAKAPTCTEAGYTAHKACTRCGKTNEDYQKIDALGHTIVDVAKVEPTCTEAGCEAHKACSVCKATDGNNKPIAPLGHKDENADAKCDVCEKWIMPTVEQAFYLRLYQAKRAETLYLNGQVSGNFLATSTNIDDAVELHLEKVEGGYYIYFMDGETKKYVDVYEWQEGSIGTTISEEPHGVWVFDADLGVFTVTMCERTVYLGTYNNYNTMSLSDTYRISGDKAADVDVSQFPSRAIIVYETEAEEDTPAAE